MVAVGELLISTEEGRKMDSVLRVPRAALGPMLYPCWFQLPSSLSCHGNTTEQRAIISHKMRHFGSFETMHDIKVSIYLGFCAVQSV